MSSLPGNDQKCLKIIQNIVKLYTSQFKSLHISTLEKNPSQRIWEEEKLKFQICTDWRLTCSLECLLADRHMSSGG